MVVFCLKKRKLEGYHKTWSEVCRTILQYLTSTYSTLHLLKKIIVRNVKPGNLTFPRQLHQVLNDSDTSNRKKYASPLSLQNQLDSIKSTLEG